MMELADDDDKRLYELFEALREHVVQVVSDLADRVQAGIVAEDDGRFGPPSLADLLGDLAGNATGVIGDLAGLQDEGGDDDRD